MKWSQVNNSFRGAFATFSELPAGRYTANEGIEGIFLSRSEVQTDELFALPRTEAEKVVASIYKFWDMEHLYEKYNILHKRGILLYGPQGTGKSSILNIVSNIAIERGVVVVDIDNIHTAQGGLQLIRNIEPMRKIVAFIEDIDSIIRINGESEVLSLLDGSAQIDNIIYIATTNHVNKLPPRIQNRPSRFDEKILVDVPNEETRRGYFSAISGEENNLKWINWAINTKGLSFAHLKEVFIAVEIFGRNLEDAVADVRALAGYVLEEVEAE